MHQSHFLEPVLSIHGNTTNDNFSHKSLIEVIYNRCCFYSSTDTIRVVYTQHLLGYIWSPIHTHAYIHTYARTYTYTCIYSNTRKRTCRAHTYKNMCMKLQLIHAYALHMPRHARTHMPIHARTRICMYTSTYTYTCIHAHTHAHTCIQKYTYINNRVSFFFY